MGILQLPTILPAQVGILPQKKRMVTTDNLATITTAGYLNAIDLQSNPVQKTDVLEVFYSFDQVTKSGTYAEFQVNISNGVITLSLVSDPAEVTLPVVSGDFAVFDGTTGTIKDAGYSATDATKTKVVMLNATPTLNNLVKFSAVNGTVADAGARIIANTTAAYAGGGTSNTFVATGLTVAAKGSAVIRASTNSVSITKALPGTDSLAITFSADPGAATTVDYIYSTATQA